VILSFNSLMVKKASPIKSYRDLVGRSVVVTSGTTNEKTMRDLVSRFNLKTTILTGVDHADSYRQLVEGKADAFATDDVLLYGFITLNKAQDQLAVVGEFLSYEPYGIMFRKDDPTPLSSSTLRRLAASRELKWNPNKWFLRLLPMVSVMSAQLAEMVTIAACGDPKNGALHRSPRRSTHASATRASPPLARNQRSASLLPASAPTL
jgi:glutamate/aspartate transport system substrate-binding protein